MYIYGLVCEGRKGFKDIQVAWSVPAHRLLFGLKDWMPYGLLSFFISKCHKRGSFFHLRFFFFSVISQIFQLHGQNKIAWVCVTFVCVSIKDHRRRK